MEIAILGTLEVRVGEQGAILTLGGTKQRALLAMLALRLNRMVPVSDLIDGLWDDGIPESAPNVVQTYVSRLRKILGPSGTEVSGSGTIRHRRPGYLLDLDPESLDLCRFQRMVREGTQHLQTAPERTSDIVGRALGIWRGEPLAEFTGLPFADTEIPQLVEQRLNALMTKVDADLMLGRHAELVPELAALTSRYPLNEGLYARLMVGLYRSGRQAEALSAYRRAQKLFTEELGMDLGRHLSELESAILTADPSLDWHAPAATARVTAAGPAGAAGSSDAESPSPGSRSSGSPGPLPAPVVQKPRIWNVPPRNPHFTGRANLIDRLRERLRLGSESLLVESLFGLGGVGKTQLIIEYAHRYARDYGLVWWVNAEQPVLIPDQLITLAGRMGLTTEGKTSDVVDAVLAALAERNDWLLIFDNAEHPDGIGPYRPPGNGHVVVTSRFPGWGGLGGRLAVDVLTRSETVDLLRTRIPDIDLELADLLAGELGDLPLAAAQAAAYLEQTALPPRDYLRRFRARRAGMFSQGDVIGYERRLDTVWDLSLERLRSVSQVAVELLEIGSFLAAEPIPLTLFTAHPELLPGALWSAAQTGPDAVVDAISAAVALSLVQRQGDNFRIHRLVQTVIRDHLSADRQLAAGSMAVSLLVAECPEQPSDPDTWHDFSLLAPHVLAAGAMTDDLDASRSLMLKTVQYLMVRGDTLASQSIAEELLERWRQVLGANHPSTLDLAGTLTSALAWLGEGERATELGQDTFDRCRATYGPDHPVTLSVATFLTSALAWTGRNEQAAGLGHDTLRRCQEVLGPDHPTTLASTAQWTFTLLGLGEVTTASELGQQTYARSVRVLGRMHPTTLTVASACTFALAWSGEFDMANKFGKETVNWSRQAFGTDHWLTSTALAGLTFALVGGGQFQEADVVSEHIVDHAQVAFGVDHWVSMLAAAARTFALIGVGDFSRALILGVDTVERCERTLGKNHPIALNLVQRLQDLERPATG